MLKRWHLIEHNNKYLLTRVAVITEHVLTTTGMWVPVQDKETAANCKGLQICEAHERKRYMDTERNPKGNINRNVKKRNRYLNK